MSKRNRESERRLLPAGAARGTICLILICLFAACRQGGVSTHSVRKERIAIGKVKRGAYVETISVTGKILPVNIVYLDALEGGRVEKIFAEAGSMIKQGDRILQLTNTDLLFDIMRRESDLSQQTNNLKNTRLGMDQLRLQLNQQLSEIENRLQQQRRVYERYKELEKENLISRHEFELAKDQYEYLAKQKELTVETQKSELRLRQAQVEALEESLKLTQADLDFVRQKLDNLTVIAPVSGQLTSLDVVVGESKSPGERLGQIDQWDGFKVRTSIDERFIALVKPKDAGTFEIGGQAYNVDVKKIYPEVRDGKFEVDLEFVGEPPPGLKRGQTLHVRLMLTDAADSLLLARGDHFRSTGGRWVYVLDQAGKSAAKTRIRLGRQNPQLLEVLEGVKEGDSVIISSYESFKNCDRLILK
jgi:HlyD family secretion protein